MTPMYLTTAPVTIAATGDEVEQLLRRYDTETDPRQGLTWIEAITTDADAHHVTLTLAPVPYVTHENLDQQTLTFDYGAILAAAGAVFADNALCHDTDLRSRQMERLCHRDVSLILMWAVFGSFPFDPDDQA